MTAYEPIPPVTFAQFRHSFAEHIKTNMPSIVLFALLGAISSYVINIYWIAKRYEGTEVPPGSPVTAGGNMIWGTTFWILASSVLFGVAGHWKSVGTEQFLADVRGFPDQVAGIFRADGKPAWVHLLWGFAGSMVLTQILSPSLRGMFAIGVVLTIPSVLGRVAMGYCSRLWSQTAARFNPGRQNRPVPLVAPAVAGLGAAAAMLLGFFIDDTPVELILALGAAGGAFALQQQGRGGPGVDRATLLLIGWLALTAMGAIGGATAAVADDGGYSECGSSWSQWWDCDGASDVRTDAAAGAVAGAVGAAAGAGAIPSLLDAARTAAQGGIQGAASSGSSGPAPNPQWGPPGQNDPGWAPPDAPPDDGGGTMTAEVDNGDGTRTRVQIGPDGTETTTVFGPDGSIISQTVVAPPPPGTMSVSWDNDDGSTTLVDTAPDGSSVETTTFPDGTTSTVRRDPDGSVLGTEANPAPDDAAQGQADTPGPTEGQAGDGQTQPPDAGGDDPWWVGSEPDPESADPGGADEPQDDDGHDAGDDAQQGGEGGDQWWADDTENGAGDSTDDAEDQSADDAQAAADQQKLDEWRRRRELLERLLSEQAAMDAAADQGALTTLWNDFWDAVATGGNPPPHDDLAGPGFDELVRQGHPGATALQGLLDEVGDGVPTDEQLDRLRGLSSDTQVDHSFAGTHVVETNLSAEQIGQAAQIISQLGAGAGQAAAEAALIQAGWPPTAARAATGALYEGLQHYQQGGGAMIRHGAVGAAGAVLGGAAADGAGALLGDAAETVGGRIIQGASGGATGGATTAAGGALADGKDVNAADVATGAALGGLAGAAIAPLAGAAADEAAAALGDDAARVGSGIDGDAPRVDGPDTPRVDGPDRVPAVTDEGTPPQLDDLPSQPPEPTGVGDEATPGPIDETARPPAADEPTPPPPAEEPTPPPPTEEPTPPPAEEPTPPPPTEDTTPPPPTEDTTPPPPTEDTTPPPPTEDTTPPPPTEEPTPPPADPKDELQQLFDEIEQSGGGQPDPTPDDTVYDLGDGEPTSPQELFDEIQRARRAAPDPDDAPPANHRPTETDPGALQSSRRNVDNSQTMIPDGPPTRTDCIDGSISLATGRPYGEIRGAIDAMNDAGLPVRTDNGMVRRPYLDDVLDGLGVRHERLVTPDASEVISQGTGGQGNDVYNTNMVDPPSAASLQSTLDRGPVLLPTDGHMRVATGYREINGRTYVTVVESQGNPPFEQLIPYDTLRTDVKWWDARLIVR